MTLFLRSLQVAARNKLQPRWESLAQEYSQEFRVLPIDIDMYGHMNHARYLNYMEAARLGFQVRTGFASLAMKRKWIAPVSHVDIQYLRSLKPFQKFTVTTRIIAAEKRFIYAYQQFRSGGKLCAHVILASAFRAGRDPVPPEAYLPELGYSQDQISVPEEIQSWFTSFQQNQLFR